MYKQKYRIKQYKWNKKHPEKIKEYWATYLKKHPSYKYEMNEYLKKYAKTLKGKYNQYRTKSHQKKREWNLSLKEFAEFWQKPCSYCGSEIKTIGIDRLDSKIGYIKNNCVSCCGICNKAKLKLSKEEFIEHCKKVVKYNQ